jgi:hypothetical protein
VSTPQAVAARGRQVDEEAGALREREAVVRHLRAKLKEAHGRNPERVMLYAQLLGEISLEIHLHTSLPPSAV